jgi:hypothetical protein
VRSHEHFVENLLLAYSAADCIENTRWFKLGVSESLGLTGGFLNEKSKLDCLLVIVIELNRSHDFTIIYKPKNEDKNMSIFDK